MIELSIDENFVSVLDSKATHLWCAAPSAPPMSATTFSPIAMSDLDEQQSDRRPASDKQRDHGWQRGFASAWMVLGAAPAGLLLGYFIDRAAGTSPAWMLGLSLLFLAVSLYQLIKDSRK